MRVQEPGRDRREAERSTRQSAPAAPDRLAQSSSNGAGPVRAPGAFSPQRTVGNRAVTAMLAARRGHDEGQGLGGDHTEGEQPVQRADCGDRALGLRVQCADAGDHTHEEPIQRATAHTVLRSAGRALEVPLRAEMEARLGADFSGVCVHTGSDARRSAQELGARAYTSGENVVIGSGGADKHTLAHELTHVIQQRQGPVAGTDSGDGLRVSDPSDRFERAAEANARRVMAAPLPSAHPAGEGDGRHVDSAGRVSRSVLETGEVGAPAVQRAVGYEWRSGTCAGWRTTRRRSANSAPVDGGS